MIKKVKLICGFTFMNGTSLLYIPMYILKQFINDG